MPRIDTHIFYQDAIARHGETAEGVHWNSTDSQERRFRVLRELLPESLDTISLVDVGCGFGDLLRYLERHNERPRRYIGLDVVPEMVERARRRTGCRILQRDALSDTLPKADYYLCSGAMNTLTRDETTRFIARCFAASRGGFVFNLLRGSDRCSTYNYRQPDEVTEWGRALGADRIVLRDGYLHHDFSVALLRDTG